MELMKLSRTIQPIAIALALTAGLNANAVTLPRIFGDNMVLQCGQSVPVWGKGAPGEEIAVAFAGQSARTCVGDDGRWRIDLKPLEASADGAAFTVNLIDCPPL